MLKYTTLTINLFIKSWHIIMAARQSVPTLAWSANNLWKPTPLALVVLVVSLVCCGFGETLIIKSNLGASPWTVLALGVDNFTPFGLGLTTLMISVFVLMLWVPLRLKLGLGTVLNALIVATSLGAFMPIIPTPVTVVEQALYLVVGIVILGVGTCFYLSCHMGGGPRDGLLVGIWQKTDKSIGFVRTIIEISVCGVGFLLGGTVGVGTILFALGIGRVMQAALYVMNYFKQSN